MRTAVFITLVAVAGIASPLQGQQSQAESGVRRTFVGGSIGYLGQEDINALSLTGSIGLQKAFLRATLHTDLGLYPDEDSPYYRDQLDNGDSRCRDSRNGQFADDANCGPAVTFAVRGEATAFVPRKSPFFLGGGYRLGELSVPYGTAGWEFRRSGSSAAGFLRTEVGERYVQIELGFGGLF